MLIYVMMDKLYPMVIMMIDRLNSLQKEFTKINSRVISRNNTCTCYQKKKWHKYLLF